jgi:flagellar protein FliS
MASFNPYNQYLNVQFGTTDQGKLILMAYDGAIRFCRTAEECIASDDKQGKGMWLTRAFDTVAELRNSLRPEVGGELAEHLNKAYIFINNQITLANVMNRPEYIQNALTMLESLRDAWREVVHQNPPAQG